MWAVLGFVAVLTTGAVVIGLVEHWSAINSLYWACVTITTGEEIFIYEWCRSHSRKHIIVIWFHMVCCNMAWIDVMYMLWCGMVVGYGDLHPMTNSGKAFTILYCIGEFA